MKALKDNQFLGTMPNYLIDQIQILQVFSDAIWAKKPRKIEIKEYPRAVLYELKGGKLVEWLDTAERPF